MAATGSITKLRAPLEDISSGWLQPRPKLLHRRGQVGIGLHLLLQLLAGVEDGGVGLASEQLADLREGAAGQLAGEIDGDLAGEQKNQTCARRSCSDPVPVLFKVLFRPCSCPVYVLVRVLFRSWLWAPARDEAKAG
jgi:hypothetical protein